MRLRADPSYSFHSSHSHKGRRMRHPLFLFLRTAVSLPFGTGLSTEFTHLSRVLKTQTDSGLYYIYTGTVFQDTDWLCFRSTETEYKRRSKSRILYRISTVGELISRLHHLEPAPAEYRYPEGRAALRYVT